MRPLHHLRKNDHILKMLIVKISKAASVQCLPNEEKKTQVLFMLCVIPSVHGCMQTPSQAASWSCSENGILLT